MRGRGVKGECVRGKGVKGVCGGGGQGVVTYTSPVEAFATGIKMESSDQRSFLEPIKGSRRFLATNIQQSKHFL